MNVPFLNLKEQYNNHKLEIDKAIENVISETAFIKGKYVDGFEKEFAAAYGVKHCIGVANGTDAIYIILKMLGIGLGDEVITVANTWISSSETITQAGAKPVFVDIERDYYCIDTAKIEENITPKTKAIIAVHLFGQANNIKQISDICKKNKLFLIEDCAQSHFTEFDNQYVGKFGVASTFSFYPGKNLGAYGDAGAILTNDDLLEKKMRMYAAHGALIKHQHQMEGINSRLDGLQAAILSAKLPYIKQWNEQRRKHSELYTDLLKDVENVITPSVRVNSKHTFHLYVIRCKQRNELQEFLKQQGIETQIHYPTPLPFLQAYNYLNCKPEDFPIANQYQHEILSLPMYPELTQTEIEFVVSSIKKFYSRK
ncbi:MAG: DegT/DnrJ/EryC1/StrS family aminotransferase [Bacteroidota bacterium]|nr:DegT/DnrJ/EryC1/StrS family aminotransferase [Bacteroidota bacterium]